RRDGRGVSRARTRDGRLDRADRRTGRALSGAVTYVSTRGSAPPVSLSDALRTGLASDGGLFIPSDLPDHRGLEPRGDLASLAAALLAPFAEGDELAPDLP